MTLENAASPRVWLITGASSGLGRAIAEAALAVGDSVVGTARRIAALDDLAARHPGRFDAVQLDVTDTARIPAVVAAAVDRFGRIDVLVNSAGQALIGAVEETTDRELRDLMDLHFFGPAALTREILPHLRRQRSGAIVQVSSMGGRMSFAGCSAYSATKFALEGLSEALSDEITPFGIRVLIVEPGAFRTGLHGAAMRISIPNPAYADTVGPVRAQMRDFDSTQPGDPAKAAAAILDVLAAEKPPLRLVLGDDAVDAISTSLDQSRSELLDWEPLSRNTALDNA